MPPVLRPIRYHIGPILCNFLAKLAVNTIPPSSPYPLTCNSMSDSTPQQFWNPIWPTIGSAQFAQFSPITAVQYGEQIALVMPAFLSQDRFYQDLCNIYAIIGNGNSWPENWTLVGSDTSWFPFDTPVSAVVTASGQLMAFAIGTDFQAYTNTYSSTNQAWEPNWSNVGKGSRFPKLASITAIVNCTGNLSLFAVGTDNQVYTNVQDDNGQWQDHWHIVGADNAFISAAIGNIGATIAFNGELSLFAVGPGLCIYTNTDGGTGNWQDNWAPIGVNGQFDPNTITPLLINGQPNLFALGEDSYVYNLQYNTAPGGSWDDTWTRVTNGQFFYPQPIGAVVDATGQPNLYAMGQDGYMYTTCPLNGIWQNWERIEDATFNIHGQVAVVWCNNQTNVFAVGTDGTTFKPAPPAPVTPNTGYVHTNWTTLI